MGLDANSWQVIVGDIIGSSGNSSATLNDCAGVTLDPMGNLYITDTKNHRIQLFSSGPTSGITIADISTQSNLPYTKADYIINSICILSIQTITEFKYFNATHQRLRFFYKCHPHLDENFLLRINHHMRIILLLRLLSIIKT
jgi:hypothetical protein